MQDVSGGKKKKKLGEFSCVYKVMLLYEHLNDGYNLEVKYVALFSMWSYCYQ